MLLGAYGVPLAGERTVTKASEAVAAAQALDLRSPLEPGAATRAAHDAIRERVTFYEADREFSRDIAAGIDLVRSGELCAAAEGAAGPLS